MKPCHLSLFSGSGICDYIAELAGFETVGPPDREKSNSSGKSRECWPTPRLNDDRPDANKANRSTTGLNLATKAAIAGKLNPAWVAQLMGWPDHYYRQLEEAFCEFWATAGRRKSRGSSSVGSKSK